MKIKDNTISNQAKYRIAGKLLALKSGDQLPLIIDLVQELGVSRGTVQNVFNVLVDSGSISIESRGHLGTFLISKSHKELLASAGINSIYFSMPIPYTKLYEGFASGLYREITQFAVPGGTFFISGSERRLKSLIENRVDVAIMSQNAAKKYIASGHEVEILYTFPNYSYIEGHYLITRSGYNIDEHNSLRLGIDYSSADQQYWVEKIFKTKRISLIPLQYMHAVESVRDKTIDACVWSIDNSSEFQGIQAKKLLSSDSSGIPDLSNTRATMVIRKGNEGIRNYLNEVFNFAKVRQLQTEVIKGSVLPEY